MRSLLEVVICLKSTNKTLFSITAKQATLNYSTNTVHNHWVKQRSVRYADGLTLTRQLNSPPQASFSIVELNGIFAHVFLCGLWDLQPQLLSHHTALYTVREGDGWIPVRDNTDVETRKHVQTYRHSSGETTDGQVTEVCYYCTIKSVSQILELTSLLSHTILCHRVKGVFQSAQIFEREKLWVAITNTF